MRIIKWLAVIAPAAAGLILDILLSRGIPDIPILYMRADVGVFLLLTGLVLTLICAGVTLFYGWSEHRLQAQAREMHAGANDERRRFLRRLDHELKNPLTAIRAGLANISEGTSGPARQEAIGSVEAQALRLSRLAADLRKLAELETRPVERVPVDMASMLEEAFALALNSPGADERRMALALPHAPWPLPKISGDQDLLFLAVHNLLDNAIKFTRPGDTVEVRAFEDSANVVVEIADTGPGISGEDMPHVWEELYRGEGARGIPGSGLGLALVRAITDRHNGQVSLRSRAGQGTVFTMRLPIG
jgi:two-component system, OmpR family, sensor kinase